MMDATAGMADITTRKMFGGYAVMWRGNMLAGVMHQAELKARLRKAFEEKLWSAHL